MPDAGALPFNPKSFSSQQMMIQPPQSPRPPRGASALNFAPVDPLKNLQSDPKSYQTSYACEFFRDLCNSVLDEHVSERQQWVENARLMSNLRSGKQILLKDPALGTLALVRPLPYKPRNDRAVYPLAQVNSSQLTSMWTLSKPRATTRHFGDNFKAQIQRALIDDILIHYAAENFDELFEQQESLSMMDYGTSAIRVGYDQDKNPLSILLPVLRNESRPIFPGYAFCRECGHDTTDTTGFAPRAQGGLPQCPECDSYHVGDIVQPQYADQAIVTGSEEVKQGDLFSELLTMAGLNWDMRKLVHQSSWIHYRSETSKRLVETVLGIEVSEDDPDSDWALAIVNALGNRGGTIKGYGRDQLYGSSASLLGGVTIMDEYWFKPEHYAGTRNEKDEMTVSGEIIPAGVPYEQIWPDGVGIMTFNGNTVLAGIWNEKPRIVGGVYHIQSNSGQGKGTQDSVEINEALNIGHSASLAILKRYAAGGGYAYDKAVLNKKEAKALMKPDGLVGLNMKGSNYTSIASALQQVEHRPISQENLAFVAQLANLLNICFQTTTFTEGVANDNVDVNTLGGQQMLQAQNQQRSAAPLRMKGYSRARIGEHFIELFREHIHIPKIFGSTDKMGLAKARFVSSEDLPERVQCDFVQDSEHPTNTFTKQMQVERMLEKSQFFGVPFIQLAELKPRLATWWASQFGAEIPLFDETALIIRCQDRLDQIDDLCAEADVLAELAGFYPPIEMAVAEIIGIPGVPGTGQLKPPVSMSEENHLIKAQIIGEVLDDDEVKEWSPLKLACVEALISMHEQMATMKQTSMMAQAAGAQMGIQAAGGLLGAAVNAPIAAAQNDAANQDADRQADRDQQAKDADFNREQTGADNQLGRDLELQKQKPPAGQGKKVNVYLEH